MIKNILFNLSFFLIFLSICNIIYNHSTNSIEYTILNSNTRIYGEYSRDIMNDRPMIEIPSIALKTSIVKGDKRMNAIHSNVSFNYSGNMPDSNSSVILMAHSGNSRHSYFTDIDKLSFDDKIYIYYENVKYIYRVVDSYIIDEFDVDILKTKKKNTLLLITCLESNKKKRLVVEAYRNIFNINSICPVNTKVVNHHVYKYTCGPEYSCQEVDECCNMN